MVPTSYKEMGFFSQITTQQVRCNMSNENVSIVQKICILLCEVLMHQYTLKEFLLCAKYLFRKTRCKLNTTEREREKRELKRMIGKLELPHGSEDIRLLLTTHHVSTGDTT